jgi:hypothetical protein
MRTRIAALVAAAAVVSGLAPAGPAAAAPAPTTARAITTAAAAVKVPKRDNGLNEPIYWIHGVQLPSKKNGIKAKADCNEFAAAIKRYKALGATGTQRTVAYYTADKNCNTRIGKFGNRGQNLGTIGKALAWDIYNRYTSKGKSVDVVAHSMGGLIIRAALTGVQKKAKGYPSKLYVEDVVTLSTPHTGSGDAKWCAVLGFGECTQMKPGSSFLKWLSANPVSGPGTDWTLIGAKDDTHVNWTSAVSTGTPHKEAGWIGAGHKVVFAKGQGLGHSDIYRATSGTYQSQYWNFYQNQWITQNAGANPITVARNANYYWHDW